ncbi:MAG: ATP-dependent Clp protease ATP-binding subunit [Dehalococcoidales bacterium]|nr:ATP-dependent Clp protease ATP-binding subunit [Dehalococcoidales bacterium]
MSLGYSDRFRRVLQHAREEASRLGHNYISVDHLLLGFLQEKSCTAVRVLQGIGVDTDELRAAIEERMDAGEISYFLGHIIMTSKANKVIERARAEAMNLSSKVIGTEHLLLAILSSENKGGLGNILASFSITYRDVLEYVEDELSRGEAEPGRKPRRRVRRGTPTLDQFGRDLTEFARQGKLDPIIGREPEIDRLAQILCRRKKNNPVLIGEPGVGKTAIVEGLAQRVVKKDVPYLLQNKRIVALDLAALVAGTKYRGQFEERIKTAMREITEAENVIIFIDEFHTIIGAGSAEGALDASNIFKPALANGEIQCIGATTMTEYRKHIEKDGALERRFQRIIVEPPTYRETIQILRGLREKYEEHHKVRILDSAIETSVRLSDRYIQGHFQPDKSLDLIDEASARVNLDSYIKPPEMLEVEKKIEELEAEKTAAIANQDFELAARKRDEIKAQRLVLETLEENWKELMKENIPEVSSEDVARVVSRITGIPLSRLEKDDSRRLLSLEDKISVQLVGQDEAVEKVAKAIRRSRAGLSDPKRPIGSFLFLGPSGVGKTELAKVLARELFDTDSSFVKIDMSEYSERFSLSRLIGAPPGYVGYEEGGQLTEAVRQHPYSVVLFDEIEKAHPDIYNILLQILDEGVLTDSFGRKVDFKNCIVIITSNVGTKKFSSTRMGFDASGVMSFEEMKEMLLKEIKDYMLPEFLNRVDEIVVFRPLDFDSILKIVDIQMEEVNQRIAHKELIIHLTPEAKEWVARKGFDEEMGARPLKRIIQKYIEDAISERILDGRIKWESDVVVLVENGHLAFKNITDREDHPLEEEPIKSD